MTAEAKLNDRLSANSFAIHEAVLRFSGYAQLPKLLFLHAALLQAPRALTTTVKLPPLLALRMHCGYTSAPGTHPTAYAAARVSTRAGVDCIQSPWPPREEIFCSSPASKSTGRRNVAALVRSKLYRKARPAPLPASQCCSPTAAAQGLEA